MSPRLAWFCAAFLTCLVPASASAGLVTVTSYDMNNGDGLPQFGDNNYYDFGYRDNNTHQIDPNAATAGASLSGGTGILTDGVIATLNYSVVSSTSGTITSAYAGSLVGQPTQYVGWKYQDPTIDFHLTSGQNVGSISLFVSAGGSGLVAAPANVLLTVDGKLVSATYSMTALNPNTDKITLSGFSLSSSDTFDLQLMRGPFQQDAINYINQFGPLPEADGLEPWLLLSQVEFFSAAVPEPSTWMLMIAGFIALGWTANRQRSRRLGALT